MPQERIRPIALSVVGKSDRYEIMIYSRKTIIIARCAGYMRANSGDEKLSRLPFSEKGSTINMRKDKAGQDKEQIDRQMTLSEAGLRVTSRVSNPPYDR